MTRVKRGTIANKRRKNVLKHAKGFKWGRKSKYKLAKDALYHAWTYAYRDRKVKKRDFRKSWQTQISAACKNLGTSYSKFMHRLKEKNVALDRKILSQLARERKDVFEKIVKETEK